MTTSRVLGRQGRRSVNLDAGAWSVEPLEGRLLKSVSTTSGSSISSLSGYSYVAQVQMGDNGYPDGAAGIIGVTATQQTWQTIQWDPNLDDGLDSDWVGVQMTLSVGGTDQAAFDVEGAETATFSGSSLTTVGSVTVRAAVMGSDMGMAWDNVTVRFYHGTTLLESVYVGGVAASTIGEWNGSPAESIATVTTSHSDCDRIEVVGAVRLTTGEGTYAGPNDIFGQVLIA